MATFKSKLDPQGNQKHEHIWDPQKNRMVATITGTLETEDPAVIDALTRLGYERTDAQPATADSPPSDKEESKKGRKAK